MPKPTISDVAARAAVSTATVSRALNGKGSVDPELIERVKLSAAELGYRPNGPARNLRRRETSVICLIIPDVREPFFTELARGVEDGAQGSGYSVVLCNADDSPAKESRYVDVAVRESAAGVLLCPTSEADIGVLLARGTPVVCLVRPIDQPRCEQVLVDHSSAAATATLHLLDEGFRRVGCLLPVATSPASAERLAGYREALARAGEGRLAELLLHADHRSSTVTQRVADWLARPGGPDAILIADPRLTRHVLTALSRLRPGREIGLVTCEDTPWAELVDPALSAIALPGYDVGSAAVGRILSRLAGHETVPMVQYVPATLVKRRSSQRDFG